MITIHLIEGGVGSGNAGHAGRPGLRGGSLKKGQINARGYDLRDWYNKWKTNPVSEDPTQISQPQRAFQKNELVKSKTVT